MNEPAAFLNSFAQAMATMNLYSPGHPARSRAVDTSFAQLQLLIAVDPHPRFSFLDRSVIYGDLPLHEMERWAWSRRLAGMGIQRLEFDANVTRGDYEVFLDNVLNLSTSEDTSQSRGPGNRSTVKFGQVGIREGAGVVQVESIAALRIPYTLTEEVGVVRWLQERAALQGTLGTAEVETVVRSLAVAMHSDSYLMAPILDLKQYDPYASVHSLNVAVLTMTFAESAGVGPRDVHDFGVAGLLHDIGMTRLAPNLLEKTSLTPEERAQVEQHPIEGARFLLKSSESYELAAAVAYEHHVRPDGTGYPAFHYPRECHYASKLVSVCSTYNALRMSRPYRPAWQMEKVLEYIHDGAGRVFDRDVAWDFVAMMQRLEGRVREMETDN